MSGPDLGKDLNRRFEYAKAFYLKALECSEPDDQKTMIEVSFALAFSFLEGTLAYVFNHFAETKQFDVFERSVMTETDIKIVKGEPTIRGAKYRSIDERLHFLFWRFSHKQFDTNQAWWPLLSGAITARNQIMHPKVGVELTVTDAENCLMAIMNATNALFLTVFGKPWPKAKKGLHSSVTV
ncbi:hypothetical protein [Mesorhizobium sp. M0998]|uniref:hypothetical protein n=1 Tax=Mesorhizobium sp. M0998 TaxID=2957044 RepID=UPI0033351520